MSINFSKVALVSIFSFCLSACEGPFSNMSNYDLSTAYNGCDFNKLTAAGAQRCNNLKKECEKRKEETGFRC